MFCRLRFYILTYAYMKLKTYKINNVEMGDYYETPDYFIFFGNNRSTLETLKTHFHNYSFLFLKQVHGDSLVVADKSKTPEADGQSTTEPLLALSIVTADCLPVLYYTKNTAVALHCGWRGLQKNIIASSYLVHKEKPLRAFIGPHIQEESFEVGHEVTQALLPHIQKLKTLEPCILPHKDSEKDYLNLKLLAQNQLFGIKTVTSNIDTLKNTKYHSFRRDKPNSGRNISFIVKKEP